MRASTALSPPETRAWSGLLRAHAALVRAVDADLHAAHGLSLSSYQALCELAQAPGGRLRMGELAQAVTMTRAGVSGLVDRLEDSGLVARRPGDADGRVIYVSLTRHGGGALRRARRTHREAVRRRYTDLLDDGELGVMTRIWERLDEVSPLR